MVPGGKSDIIPSGPAFLGRSAGQREKREKEKGKMEISFSFPSILISVFPSCTQFFFRFIPILNYFSFSFFLLLARF